MLPEHYFQKIVKNSAQCLSCKDILVSTHTHDFKTCSCGKVSVDGGPSYIKRSYSDKSLVLELSQYRNMTKEELLDQIRKADSDMRTYTYSDGYYRQTIEAARHYLKKWYNVGPDRQKDEFGISGF